MPRKLLLSLIDTLFPRACIYCGLYDGSFLCKNCKANMIQLRPESYISRKPSKDWSIEKDYKSQTKIEKVYYFYEYGPIIHALMQEIKYNNRKHFVDTLIEILIEAKEFQKIDFKQFDLITYIPLHPKKEKIRGFNQTEVIAEKLSDYLQIPYLRLLTKTKETKSQADLNREHRLKNLEDAFELKKDLPIEIKSQRILIIDDICTTGSTFNECAKTLKKSYPDIEVFGLALARGK
jgi:competence protein ComFC